MAGLFVLQAALAVNPGSALRAAPE